MKTAFDDYDCPTDIRLHDPSPRSTTRMVFLTPDKSDGDQGRYLGQIIDLGSTIKVIRGMGDSGVTVRDISAGVRLLKGA